MEKIKDLKDIIEQEDLNPNYFKREARAIVMEFDREYTDPNYVIEKVRHLVDIAFLVCRAEHGRANVDEVNACVERLISPRRWHINIKGTQHPARKKLYDVDVETGEIHYFDLYE